MSAPAAGAANAIRPTSPPIVHWSGLTHVGRVRKNNEDAFLALTGDEAAVPEMSSAGR